MYIKLFSFCQIVVNDYLLEKVEDFIYFGSIMSKEFEYGICKDIKVRFVKVCNVFLRFNNIWKFKYYSLQLKLKIYNSNYIRIVLLYGLEC